MDDDQPIGQLLSRRDALKLLGLGSAAFLAACAAPEGTSTLAPTSASTLTSSTQAPSGTGTVLDCVVRPEMTIGPYFVDDQLNRSDVRSEPSDNSVKEGLPLTMLSVSLMLPTTAARPSSTRKWMYGIVMDRESTPAFLTRVSIPPGKSSCAVIN